MTSNLIRVLVLEPEQPITPISIPNTLEAKQKLVGGYIEVVPLDYAGRYPLPNGYQLDLIIHEEGKLIGLPMNRPIWGGQDYITGTALVALADLSTGEYVSLTPEAEAIAKKLLQEG